jgi:hypothetical protein
MRLKINLTN